MGPILGHIGPDLLSDPEGQLRDTMKNLLGRLLGLFLAKRKVVYINRMLFMLLVKLLGISVTNNAEFSRFAK